MYPLPSRPRHCLYLVYSTAFVTKTQPAPYGPQACPSRTPHFSTRRPRRPRPWRSACRPRSASAVGSLSLMNATSRSATTRSHAYTNTHTHTNTHQHTIHANATHTTHTRRHKQTLKRTCSNTPQQHVNTRGQLPLLTCAIAARNHPARASSRRPRCARKTDSPAPADHRPVPDPRRRPEHGKTLPSPLCVSTAASLVFD